MRGRHTLRVQSAHLRYDLTFTRNLTILQGDSATGKTTLVDMIQEYLLNGSDTGITLVCDCPCRVVSGSTWADQLRGIDESIVFIDEGNRFVSTPEFARAVRDSGNYYVIVTREALDNLPYSVTEIYGLRSSGKFQLQEPVHHQMYRIYGDMKPLDERLDELITEDSGAGNDFFSGVLTRDGATCSPAGGAARIFEMLKNTDDTRHTLVIADGAAFGPQMRRVYRLMMERKGIGLYLPESFEWLILCAGILRDREVQMILEAPYDHIDAADYFSWERYFTALLTERTSDTWMRYTKARLNPVYLQPACRDQILAVLPKTVRDAIAGN